jgi:cytochrome c553
MTSDDRPGLPDRRFANWIITTIVLFLLAAAIGFIWLPLRVSGAGGADIWGVICRAIGVPQRSGLETTAVVKQPASSIAWTPATRRFLTGGDASRGVALAATCNPCHGATGVSSDAAIPNLAGHSVAAIYKQIEDFRNGKREPAVMGVYVGSLSQQDLLDIATHFAALPDPFVRPPETSSPDGDVARRLIVNGDPMRGVASCAACHGPQGVVPGAPGLRGQQRAYAEQQMLAFKAGIRHNDIDAQMRGVARQLTDDEIAVLADYYSSFAGGQTRR